MVTKTLQYMLAISLIFMPRTYRYLSMQTYRIFLLPHLVPF